MTITNTTQPTDLSIRRAGPADRHTVAATITAAFFDDPVTRWLLPDLERRQAVAEPVFRLYADAYVELGETYLTGDGNGVAAWLPPGKQLFTPEQEAVFGQAMEELFGADASRLFQLEETFGQHHPTDDLWYLNFLATVPAFQGRGIGSVLLRTMLERADEEGIPAYHEATTPRNRALYERHGYITLGELELPAGPTLWRMWRDPR
jgi:GNAT superfamily N-acetyltransferase